jgi:uncharacterized protein (DUF486 family)
VAPVIFYPSAFLGDGVLSHFQSGVLMTQVFLRFNILLMICTFVMLSSEVYAYLRGGRDMASAVLLFVIICGALAFVLYFTPYIVDAQKIGAEATTTAQFRKIHDYSELVIKVVLAAQVALFVRRLWVR